MSGTRNVIRRTVSVRPEVRVVDRVTADRCKVYVDGEDITLIFERTSAGIMKVGQERGYDAVLRASNLAFAAARKLACRRMNEADAVIKERIARVHDHVILDSGSPTECVLVYFNRRISYVCDADALPVWDNVRRAAVMDERSKYGADTTSPLPMLDDREWHALKARAVGVIIAKRRIEAERFDDLRAAAQLAELQPKLL